MKIDKSTKEILKNLDNFHKKRIDKQTSDAKEYKVYDGELVEPVTDGKSKTMKAIEEFEFDNFFKSNEHKKPAPRDLVRRKLPDGLFVVDGATGSELDRRGVDCSMPLWGSTANLVAHDVLLDVHKHYLMSGAKAITTNTFCCNERRLGKIGLGHLAQPLMVKAAEIAV